MHRSLLRVDQKNNEDNRNKAKKSSSNEGARVARCGEKTTYTGPQQETGVKESIEHAIRFTLLLSWYNIHDEGASRRQDGGCCHPLDETQGNKDQRVSNQQVSQRKHRLGQQTHYQDLFTAPAVGQPANRILKDEIRDQVGRCHRADDNQRSPTRLRIENPHRPHHANAYIGGTDSQRNCQQRPVP